MMSLGERYNELRRTADQCELPQLMAQYESLFREAESAGDAEIAGRCLSDLAVLAAPHDVATARDLLGRALQLSPDDPSVLENMGSLHYAAGEVEAARAELAKAVDQYLVTGDVGRAATSIDLLQRCLDERSMADREVWSDLLTKVLKSAETHFPANAAPSNSREVLLLAGGQCDSTRMRSRIEKCQERGEVPVILQGDDTDYACDVEILRVRVSDPSQLMQVVADANAQRRFARVEVLANAHIASWTLAAMAAGVPVSVDRDPLLLPPNSEPQDQPAIRSNTALVDGENPELSVIVPCYGRVPQLQALLESLRRQTLERRLFEVIVVDDGNEVPLQDALSEEDQSDIQILRQENTGPAAARNTALKVARGQIAVFVNADAILGDQALAQHREEHQRAGRPVAILGRFDPTESSRNFFGEIADHAGVLFPYQQLKEREPLPANYFWTCNISVPVTAVRQVGGFDESCRPNCEDIELGARLAAVGVAVEFVAGIECWHDHRMTVRDYLRRTRQIGHDWVRVAQKLGAQQPLLFSEPVTPSLELANELVQYIGQNAERHARFVKTLLEAEQTLDPLLAAKPEERQQLLSAILKDSITLVQSVFDLEVRYGVLAGILDVDIEHLGDFDKEDKISVICAINAAHQLDSVPSLLRTLPENAELLVMHSPEVQPRQHIADPRLVMGTTQEHPAGSREVILQETSGELLVLLNHDTRLDDREWKALRLFHNLFPTVGALGLAAAAGSVATAQMCTELNEPVIATSRELVARDEPEPNSTILQRLAAAGYDFLRVVPAMRQNAEPSTHTQPVEVLR